MGEFFPELKKNPKRVIEVIKEEEESFGRTLEQGTAHFADAATAGSIKAADAFKLHDTYGFPIDLTQIMAEERGLTVDVDGFHKLMEEARERSRTGGATGASAETKALKMDAEAVADLKSRKVAPTDDHQKFERLIATAKLRAIWTGTLFVNNIENLDATQRVALITDRTNFYAEMGGQVADTGEIHAHSGAEHTRFTVENTVAVGGYILHVGRLEHGKLRIADELELRVDTHRRLDTAANHTATHLLNHALRAELGENIDQKGSLVAPDKLRFDFSFSGAVGPKQLKEIEIRVRTAIKQKLPVDAKPAPLSAAKKINSLRAVFGETYPDPVRVVSIGPTVDKLLADPDATRWHKFSIEFCGGTHLKTTEEAQAFAIIEETAVAKGIRRMSALTRTAAEQAITAGGTILDELTAIKKLEDTELEPRTRAIAERIEAETIPLALKLRAREAVEALNERIKGAHKASAAAGRDEAVAAARTIAESATGDAIVAEIPAGSDRAALLAAMDTLRANQPNAAVMLLSADHAESKVSIVAAVPENHIKSGLKAGDWVRTAAQACGGKGGGKPDKAQGGGTEPEKITDAANAARAFAESHLGSSTSA